LDLLEFTLSGLGEAFALVKTPQGLRQILEPEATPAAVLLLENADGLTDHCREIPELMEKGIRIVGLTHVGSNRLGDGSHAAHSRGLTQEGRETVKALVEYDLLLDVAHLHQKCFRDLLDLCEGPLVSSHAGLRRLCDSPGNLDPDQVREIVARGGLIGITFNPEMLSEDGTADVEQIFIHIDWIVQKYGPGAAAIGSGFGGFDRPVPGLEDISRVTALEALMDGHGYGKEAVADILGRNWLRIYERLLG
jgi:membrane dipeptidase